VGGAVDASQLENALLNLCINARDAMAPHGGRLTIHCHNEVLDAAAAAALDVPPGEYVHVSVADTGAGMTPEVMARAFDPFFTTKPLGQGTGLGLSMIYGFVRQSGGQVRIDVRAGPRHHHAPGPAPPPGRREDSRPRRPARRCGGDGEVILLIEDETDHPRLVTRGTGSAGYRVLSARTARRAAPAAVRCAHRPAADGRGPAGRLNGGRWPTPAACHAPR
jgi:hypothetical protein